MAIKYEDQTFDVVDNGDGTFTLTPTAPVSADDLIAEYRVIREEAKRLLSRRDAFQAKAQEAIAELQVLRARRDELKLLLETSGRTDADDDLTPTE